MTRVVERGVICFELRTAYDELSVTRRREVALIAQAITRKLSKAWACQSRGTENGADRLQEDPEPRRSIWSNTEQRRAEETREY